MTTHRRIVLSPKTRRYITAGNICAYCGKGNKDGEGLQVDHVAAVSIGSDNSKTNLRPLCSNCNQRKGKKTESEFIRTLMAEIEILQNQLKIQQGNCAFDSALERIYEKESVNFA